jgi:DNA-binding FadR family transcriptional regulator
MIADILRERIVSGGLKDGDLLPKQEDLLDEFQVSKPSLREAIRILETEGLVTVRRGNLGGALVHSPKPHTAAYMLGLVLESRHVPVRDLADSLRYIEPICAGLCAERDDRARSVVPILQDTISQSSNVLDDGVQFTRLSRRFHEQLVTLCGNTTMIILVGALESLWSYQEEQWAVQAEAQGLYPDRRLRREVLNTHGRILKAIERGDVSWTTTLARRHLAGSQRYALQSGEQRTVQAVRNVQG